jgi:LysM repeat protein
MNSSNRTNLTVITHQKEESTMKRSVVLGAVIGTHCLVIGAMILIPGCRKSVPIEEDTAVIMPPTTPELTDPIDPRPSQWVRQPETAVIPFREPAPVVAAGKTYIVVRNDCLSTIAYRHASTVRDLAALNGLNKPYRLLVGQRLTLPANAKLRGVTAAKPAPAPIADGSVYLVKSGDCLSKIAVRHGMTVKEVRKANGLTSDRIYAGQKLSVAKTPPPGAAIHDMPEPAAIAPPVVEPTPAPEPGLAPLVVDSPEPATPAPVASTSHTVLPGETLANIVSRYGISAKRIMAVNGLTTKTVTPGMVLKIPHTQ